MKYLEVFDLNKNKFKSAISTLEVFYSFRMSLVALFISKSHAMLLVHNRILIRGCINHILTNKDILDQRVSSCLNHSSPWCSLTLI